MCPAVTKNSAFSFKLSGDLTQQQKEEIVATGKKYSPVFDMMSRAVPALEVTVL